MSGSSGGGGFAGFLRSFVRAFLKSSQRGSASQRGSTPQNRSTSQRHNPEQRISGAGDTEVSPGQYGSGATRDLTASEIRALRPSYDPAPDGDPDPGEVVWTWVPYEENDGRGKDRPVLIIARIDAGATAGCYLSTKQRSGFVSVGTGGWDGEGRESFLAPDRVLRISDEGMRREGHVLPRERFEEAAGVVSRLHGIH